MTSRVSAALWRRVARRGLRRNAVESGEACLDRLPDSPTTSCCSHWLPGMDGWRRCADAGAQFDAQVVIISGHGNVESAVRAIKMGAFDFVEKPVARKTVLVVRNALRQRRLEAENLALRAKVDVQHLMIGESYVMMKLRSRWPWPRRPTDGC